ncbi:MAG: NAD-glutamate dehydrogenase, partial [bacterium]|nr:NAD-glutamate dehydrogenase [bacterium]
IFLMGLQFVDSVKKTNFFKPRKAALSFKLDPGFLSNQEKAVRPFALFYLYGRRFKGYHVRFQDISRGGVRIVRSHTREEYLKNSDENFLEVFNLAYTQEKKNKDIPEGGSKGIILPYYTESDTDLFFRNYIDAMLDLMLKDRNIITSYDPSTDLIFLGPDEGSGHLVDWASLRAKERGYIYWRAFTTGKSSGQGGVSHIDYGMTTAGVHQYVLDLLERMGLKEENVTKVQTGGPDGDLGSNEILASRDRTIAVIDGSGTAYDPQGLNRNELKRLAGLKKPIVFFNKFKLARQGFVYSIKDRNIRVLGKIFKTGIELRNEFHFLVSADLFVPAGGRPKAVNISNWQSMLLPDNKPRYKMIVEGANLFITQDARIKLENSGVIIIKDSSANKGGVTSSSLEVLVSMLLENREFEKLMCVKQGREPEFRRQYIRDILALIRLNADREFNLLWEERTLSQKPISLISDSVSGMIVRMTNSVKKSGLISNKKISDEYLERFVPSMLRERVSRQKLIQRLPENYRRSVVAREIAREFVYKMGITWTRNILQNYKTDEAGLIRAYLKAAEDVDQSARRNKVHDPDLLRYLNAAKKDLTIKKLK